MDRAHVCIRSYVEAACDELAKRSSKNFVAFIPPPPLPQRCTFVYTRSPVDVRCIFHIGVLAKAEVGRPSNRSRFHECSPGKDVDARAPVVGILSNFIGQPADTVEREATYD